MKLIEPSVEILEQSSGLDGIYEQIEIAGRTCYKSEPKYDYFFTGKNPHDGGKIIVQISKEFDGEKAIKHAEKEYLNGNKQYTRRNTSAKEFVDRMIKSGHGAMLEHGTVYLHLSGISRKCFESAIVKKYEENKYSKVQEKFEDSETDYRDWYVTTNYRVLVENNWLDDLQYICEPTEYHEKRITAKFICDRGVSHELVRHRVFSFAQESTRYCNYSKDKFGNELTFIKPNWLDMKDKDENREVSRLWNIDLLDICSLISEEESLDNRDTFLGSLMMSEYSYFNLLKNGTTPQLARQTLPNALKTEIVMTGFESDWEGFFKLRCNKAAHPDAQVLANKLKELMQ